MTVETPVFSKKIVGLWLIGLVLTALTLLLVVWAVKRAASTHSFTLFREIDMSRLSQ